MAFTLLAEAGGRGRRPPRPGPHRGTVVGGALRCSSCARSAACTARRHGSRGLQRARAVLRARLGPARAGPRCPPPSPASRCRIALFGFWWDVATHIDQGRDDGPLGNPPTGRSCSASTASSPPASSPSSSAATSASRDRRQAARAAGTAPLGGVLLPACGGFALLGFPLDDTWHRVFGQDVTLWGPTHVLMIGGARSPRSPSGRCWSRRGASARRPACARHRRHAARPRSAHRPPAPPGDHRRLPHRPVHAAGRVRLRRPAVPMLSSTPMLIALAAGSALVAARIVLGRGGALQAVAFYLRAARA